MCPKENVALSVCTILVTESQLIPLSILAPLLFLSFTLSPSNSLCDSLRISQPLVPSFPRPLHLPFSSQTQVFTYLYVPRESYNLLQQILGTALSLADRLHAILTLSRLHHSLAISLSHSPTLFLCLSI